jgi:hypothetical protein
VFLSDGSSKTLQKTFCKKNRVEKFLQKIRPKIQNRLFLEKIFITFLGVSIRGVQKHDKKNIEKINPTPVPSPFSYSDPPTHHGGGGPRFFFGILWPWMNKPAFIGFYYL